MLTKKVVIILVIIALILAGIAITIQLSNDTEEVSTTQPAITGNSIKGGNIGVEIIPSPIEDKLSDEGQP